jgi:plasmid stabilization system protein ParE
LHLIVRTDAEDDMMSAYEWYEEQREGLGLQFMEEVSIVIDAAQSAPRRFPVTFRNLRRALVHRFPYGVFFVANSDAIVVTAVMHLARDPRRLRGRTR